MFKRGVSFGIDSDDIVVGFRHERKRIDGDCRRKHFSVIMIGVVADNFDPAGAWKEFPFRKVEIFNVSKVKIFVSFGLTFRRAVKIGYCFFKLRRTSNFVDWRDFLHITRKSVAYFPELH